MPERLIAAVFITTILLLMSSSSAEGQPLLHPLFSEHAVVQRDAPIDVFGYGIPGEVIRVRFGDETASAEVAANGRWLATLPPHEAGGPYRLRVEGAEHRAEVVEDILVGDVFLCSGQSNMEWPMRSAMNAHNEIAAARNPRIRHLTVHRSASPELRHDFEYDVEWQIASPETVAEWSAVCYFFGRELQGHTDAPIGLIHAAWGGTDIRSWMSPEALREVGGYDQDLRLLELHRSDEREAQQMFGERWGQWWRERAGVEEGREPWQPDQGTDWPEAPSGLGDWKGWGVPELDDFFGMVWHRATLSLTAEQAQEAATLSLGAIDEVDQTWLNGETVGHTFGWGTDRTYELDAGMLREGENVLMVAVHNSWGQGGMVGDPEARYVELQSGGRIPLGSWQYRREEPEVGAPPRAPWVSVGGRTTLYNAMLAPIGPYGIRAVAWYQGESNVVNARDYDRLLEAFIEQLRRQFGDDLPALVVQLANFGPPHTEPVESSWAVLRDAQRRVAEADQHVGLAVTIDIGESTDIHPPNKQDVGRRLAHAARDVIFGERIGRAGPRVASARLDGATLVISFEDVSDELVAYSQRAPIGFEVCGESAASCRFVDASIEGRTFVRLAAEPNETVTRVRYLWADSPVANLYDRAGLPVGPFEIEVER